MAFWLPNRFFEETAQKVVDKSQDPAVPMGTYVVRNRVRTGNQVGGGT